MWVPGIELTSQACCAVTDLGLQPKLVCFEIPESIHADTWVLSVARTSLCLLQRNSWGVLVAKQPDLTAWRKVTSELHPLPSGPTVGVVFATILLETFFIPKQE